MDTINYAVNQQLVEALRTARWRIANLVGPSGAQGLDRQAIDQIDAALASAEGGHGVQVPQGWSETVDIARSVLEVRKGRGITAYGVQLLCKAVLDADACLNFAAPEAPAQADQGGRGDDWPAELSRDRTERARFGVVVDSLAGLWIDDDDFIFDASIKVDGDFPDDATKRKYLDEIVRRLNGCAPATYQADQGGQGVVDSEFIHELLWGEYPECCGNPVVGAEYMGQVEMVCCGCPEPSQLSDAQIVAALRERFPEAAAPEAPAQAPMPWAVFKQVTTALAGLLEQVEKFTSAHGEADFETGEALRAVEAAIQFDAQMPAQAAPSAGEVERSDGELWSFLRSVMAQGADIHQDYIGGRHTTYEHYSARLDVAASERVKSLRAALTQKGQP